MTTSDTTTDDDEWLNRTVAL